MVENMEMLKHPRLMLIGLPILLVANCCAAAPKGKAIKAAQAEVESIGVATQEGDGTIILMLRATGAGAIGDAQFRYPPTHPQYAMIKAHVGPIPPGKSVSVRPFPQ
jgi:hypothetical protein